MTATDTKGLLLVGPLTAPELLSVLGVEGVADVMPGQLRGGALAGLGGDWPAWADSGGQIAVLRAQPTDDLLRYLRIVGLEPQQVQGLDVWGLGQGGGADWDRSQAALMARTAAMALSQETTRSDESAAARLRRIAEIAAVRLRVAAEPDPVTHLPAPDPGRVAQISRHEAYGRFFSVEEIALRHRRFDGNWSPVLDREVFISADAALLLPYDPVADTVLLISQFRVGPMARGQVQCWMLEPIAGRVDADESPADAARREAVEEAGLQIGQLYPLPPHYPTPGANSEFFYPFIATVDLSGREAGQGFGLASEGEDIATHIIPREELVRLALSGQIQCGPLLSMAMMLDRMVPEIRADLAGS